MVQRLMIQCAVVCVGLTLAATHLLAQRVPSCDADNGGITLPPGFCALVVADAGGRVRHIEVRPNGDIFVGVMGRRNRDGSFAAAGGVLALRDADGDGRAEVRESFGPEAGGNSVFFRGDTLYFAPNDAILRYHVPLGDLRPASGPDTLVYSLPATQSHTAKTVVVTDEGRLLVNIGSPSNVCQGATREPRAPGQDPCPELQTRAGIWSFDAKRTGQTQTQGRRFATGIRNAVGMTLHAGRLWVVQHGRDLLFQAWPEHFDQRAGAELPSEELLQVNEGDDFGWPYCFYDHRKRSRMLAPEYGGDGDAVGRCARAKDPVHGFPGHWAPNDLLFYTASQFPERYRGGVFIAFHGSWNRSPEPQAGYNVTFLPMRDGVPSAAEFEVFADGFAGADTNRAERRPTGLALGPDGSLFVADDATGRIWRIVYRGN